MATEMPKETVEFCENTRELSGFIFLGSLQSSAVPGRISISKDTWNFP